MLLGRAPLRISFSGGGTDLEEYHNYYDGYSISATINKYTYVIAKLRRDKLFQGFSPDFASHLSPRKYHKIKPLQGHEIVLTCLHEMNFVKGVDMFFCTDVAPGSGLGASSSLASNLVNVVLRLQGRKWDKNKIAMKAYRIGHDILKWGIGKQDEFAAVFGGINIYRYTKKKVTVEPILLKKSTLQELQNNSLLFYLGDRKASSELLKIQIQNMKKSNSSTMSALHKVKEFTLEMRDAFKNSDLTLFSEIIKKGWEQKKKYAKGISNPRIDEICKSAYSSGGDAMKVTGAGGGGHLYVYAEPPKHNAITKSLKKFGVRKVDFKYQNIGATVLDVGNI